MWPGWEPRATRRPAASSSPQLKSWDSRTMVEKPVRKTAFSISRTMPSRRALITSKVMTSSGALVMGA